MDTRGFYEKHGIDRCREVCARVPIEIGTFRQYMCGYRRPSPETAEGLVTHSGGEMDFISLLRPVKRARKAR